MSTSKQKSDDTFVGNCIICGDTLYREDGDLSWVFHESQGLMCKRHPGVMEWYQQKLDELLIELNSFMEQD